MVSVYLTDTQWFFSFFASSSILANRPWQSRGVSPGSSWEENEGTLLIIIEIYEWLTKGYLGPHHRVSLPRCTLPVRHQTGIVSWKERFEDRLTERLVDPRLIGEMFSFRIGRIEAIIETISLGPFSTVPSLAGRHLQVRQRDPVRVCTNHHLRAC